MSGFLGHGEGRFKQLQLHELADSINEFGGPFQTVLLVNSYQYLYFGSSRSPECYRDHETIFGLIRQVCSGRVLFSNRTELGELQRSCQAEAMKIGHQAHYTEEKILDAASRFFHVRPYGRIGKWPFWLLDVPGGHGKVPLDYPWVTPGAEGSWRIEAPDGTRHDYGGPSPS